MTIRPTGRPCPDTIAQAVAPRVDAGEAFPMNGPRSSHRLHAERTPMRHLVLIMALLASTLAGAADLVPVISQADLDRATFAEWMDGAEHLIGPDRRSQGPAWVIWTRDSQPGFYGQEFGDSLKPGPRHLRIGFVRPVAIGTILSEGGSVSVLKPGAAYPGDLGDDRQWIQAERIGSSALITTADGNECATWILPPGTVTRAIRITHVANQNDRRYNGWLGALCPLAGRYDNIAVQAAATASTNSDAAGSVIDGRDNGAFGSWDNGPQGQERPISPKDPAWIMLSWKQPRRISGLCAIGIGAAAVKVQICTAPAGTEPALAPDAAWKTVVEPTAVDPQYPRSLPLSALPFARDVTTRAVRLLVVKPFDDQHCHPHLVGSTRGGKRVWLAELMALSPLGLQPLKAPVVMAHADDHPPIPIRFHLDKPGFVTLVIEDAEGNRIRNLVSETRFPAGDDTAWWDGLDDRGRDEDAASHHIYHIPGRLVAPGTYHVRGLFRDGISLTYEFSFYTHGTPAWDTADGTGGWLANHTPPQACAFVPPGMTKDGKEWMLLGSPITEGGSGLAWVDLEGRKHHGQGWIGGNWTGAAYLAVDLGPKRFPGFYAYAASAAEGELRLSGLKSDGSGDAPVLHWKFPKAGDCDCAGVAVHDGILAASLPKLNAILFIDVAGQRVLGLLPCQDPRGIAIDAQGRLWAISGKRVLRATLPSDLIDRCVGAEIDHAAWKATANVGQAALAIDGRNDTRWTTQRTQRPGEWFQLDLGKRQRIGRITLDTRGSEGDFPRGVDVFVSDDGNTWGKAVLSVAGTPGITNLILPATRTRYVKLVSTGTDGGVWWSINEIHVCSPPVGFPVLDEQPIIAGLEDPIGICTDAGHVYVSDRGKSHQVKVFGTDGTLQRVVGKAGEPAVGPYDPLHMNNPAGVAIDGRGRLWVAEYDNQPKRVSVWNPDGTLAQAFYGPARYGCGGTIDPADQSRLFFEGMEFALDWDKGTSSVKNIIWRGGLDVGGEPERMEHVHGHSYLTSTYNSNPTGGAGVVGIWRLDHGVAVPIASAGRAQWWGPIANAFARLDRFSVRWTGKVVPTVTGLVTFHTISDDGVRLWVGGRELINNWTPHGPTADAGTIAMTAGKAVDIRLEWFQSGGGAEMHLSWSAGGLPEEIIPSTQLIPAGGTGPGGLRGEYNNEINLDQLKFTRIDPVIRFDIPPGGGIDIPGNQAAAFQARLPPGTQFGRDSLFYVWSDRNHDGKVSADEVTFHRDDVGAVTVQPDLSLATATGLVVKPTGFDATGLPLYDASTATAVVPGGRTPITSGGGNTLTCPDGWTVLTIPPAPFPQQSSMSGAKDGVLRWTYPSLWPGLHPSHESPVPDRPGELIGTTRLLGPEFQPKGSDAGWCWAINGNQGSVYVFTSDGLFVATLFKDGRQASSWAMPTAERGMHLEDTSLGQEDFWPSITQTADGRVYLVSGSCITRVGGLRTIRRLPPSELMVSAGQLAAAANWTIEREARRQRDAAGGPLRVAITRLPPKLDGDLGAWTSTDWATIDRRQVQTGDWGSRVDLVQGAIRISGDRLYAAWKNAGGDLLRNAGSTWQTLFKFGGCLDLMIGADGTADPDRAGPVAGDSRLLVTFVQGKLVAVLYRPVVPGHTGDRFAFTSPVSSIAMDEVVRVDDQVQLASRNGDYELSVPLKLLGLKPQAGGMIKADIGILRGNGFQTMQRCYWSNKATSMTADVPSEARLTPVLWGRWIFEQE